MNEACLPVIWGLCDISHALNPLRHGITADHPGLTQPAGNGREGLLSPWA